MYREVAHAVYRRGEATMGGYELPGWGWGLLVLDVIIFLPFLMMVRTNSTEQAKSKVYRDGEPQY